MPQAANITAERLASFDRPIKSEPAFKPDQREGLITDLSNYLQTLKASCISFSFSASGPLSMALYLLSLHAKRSHYRTSSWSTVSEVCLNYAELLVLASVGGCKTVSGLRFPRRKFFCNRRFDPHDCAQSCWCCIPTLASTSKSCMTARQTSAALVSLAGSLDPHPCSWPECIGVQVNKPCAGIRMLLV